MSQPPPIPPPARPVFVWIICGYFVFSLTFAALSLWFVRSGIVPLPPAQQAYFNSLTPLDYGISYTIMALNLVGAVTLFLRRRIAMYLFALAVVLGLGSIVFQIVARNYLQAMGAAAPGAIVGLAIPIAIVFYAWHLTKSGYLR